MARNHLEANEELEIRAQNGTAVTLDIKGYMRTIPVYPTSGTTFEDSYTISTVGPAPVCQIKPETHKLK